MSDIEQREGVLVRPHERLSESQIRLIDGVSRDLLEDPGLRCFNERAAALFVAAGARKEDAKGCVRLRIPSSVIDKALETAPSKIVLGARDPNNRLILDAHEPRVRFGSGAETNIWLDVQFENGHPKFERLDGSIERLCAAAHLAENLEHLDFFIRCVNIRDPEVTEANKDVNKLLASLNNITKHVQAGLTSLSALDEVLRLGRIIAGGEEAFRENPVLSFITCVVKSPLQIVDDTAEKLIEISRRGVPVVISSCPMGGATGPFEEFGMVAQINAELLAGVALNQLASPGCPVLYGAVPVRTRLDNLNDMYGAAEFNHYNLDCAQMARFYGLPCYSTAGVGDTDVPGIQATVEKMLTLMDVPRSGAQYIHYAFGLLERTNVFCPEQAILDEVQIGLVKYCLREPNVSQQRRDEVLATAREVMASDHRTFIYHLPLPTRENVYVRYPLEDERAGALRAAHRRFGEILDMPRKTLPRGVQQEILGKFPNVLPQALQVAEKASAS
jgi:trimethylamine--corrinoid protein Co-methyltransferase